METLKNISGAENGGSDRSGVGREGDTETREKREGVTSEVVLRFFRHERKDKATEGKPDRWALLTEQGRRDAVTKSQKNNMSRSVAFGGPRERSQHTAGLVMAGQEEGVTGNETLEELKGKLNKVFNEELGKEFTFGRKIAIDERLDFYIDEESDFGKKLLEEYAKGEYLKFSVEKSDDLAESLQDTKADTYSRMAGRIAEIVKKYIDISVTWNRIVQEKKYEDEDMVLKRFNGTHQGVAESFLAKVIEKTKGVDERDAFVSVLHNGFDFAEGFDIKIETIEGKEQRIRISFKKEKEGKTVFEFNEIVSQEIIENMISGK